MLEEESDVVLLGCRLAGMTYLGSFISTAGDSLSLLSSELLPELLEYL